MTEPRDINEVLRLEMTKDIKDLIDPSPEKKQQQKILKHRQDRIQRAKTDLGL